MLTHLEQFTQFGSICRHCLKEWINLRSSGHWAFSSVLWLRFGWFSHISFTLHRCHGSRKIAFWWIHPLAYLTQYTEHINMLRSMWDQCKLTIRCRFKRFDWICFCRKFVCITLNRAIRVNRWWYSFMDFQSFGILGAIKLPNSTRITGWFAIRICFEFCKSFLSGKSESCKNLQIWKMIVRIR